MREIVLINVSGADKPGLTALLTEMLAKYQVNILDMGQAVIHDSLALGLLIEIPAQEGQALAELESRLLDELINTMQGLGLQAKATKIGAQRYAQWVDGHGKPKYFVSLLARRISAEHIARLSKVTHSHGLNIEDIQRLSGRTPVAEGSAKDDKACLEFVVRGTVQQPELLREEFLALANELDVDIAFQEDSIYRRNRRLVCFDMDSTLIEAEVIDQLAALAGVGERVAAITESAMRGELDFKQSLTERVKLLAGSDANLLQQVLPHCPLTEGAEGLIKALRALGYRTAILSGGFQFFGDHLANKLGIDYVYANELEIRDGKLTGAINGDIVDGERKAVLLKELATRERISLQQVIAVGDGANDLPMLSCAGLGIAFRAKPLVRETAEHSISTLGLDGILYLLGLSDAENIA